MAIGRINSAEGILSALNWPCPQKEELNQVALRKLMTPCDSHGTKVVDVFWHEIAGDHLLEIEALAENNESKCQSLASLVASKVHFHLGSYEQSKSYALGAAELFDTKDNSDYTNCIISQCIDSYKESRSSERFGNSKLNDKQIQSFEREEAIVNSMFEKCFMDGQFRHCMGLAIETKRLDIFARSITEASDNKRMLSYAFQIVMKFVENRTYRFELLEKIQDIWINKVMPSDYENVEKKTITKIIPAWHQMVQCLVLTDKPDTVAAVLEQLVKGSSSHAIMAYDIAFQLYESATQQFLGRVIGAWKDSAIFLKPVNSDLEHTSSAVEQTNSGLEPIEPAPKDTDVLEPTNSVLKLADSVQEELTNTEKEKASEDEDKNSRFQKLRAILSGSETILLNMKFLSANDKTDKAILNKTKDVVRTSISHTATVIANGFMSCGTTHDDFLRNNIDWLARSANWAKFSCSASLGVLHHGHEKDSTKTLQEYLPKNSNDGFGYAEGGGLFALGLIHANHGGTIIDYLIQQVKTEGATAETLKHGACLGLGLAAMGTQRDDIYELMKSHLYMDDAVVGEAASLAIGLVELGSGNATALSDMVAYGHETQHEKIIRGIAVGLALIMYGRLEEADNLIEALCNEQDSILRRAGMYTIAMAYCGSGSNKAIRKLLHVAVSDVNDDVRRAAVTSLGFLLFKTPDKCPGLVSLLSESYNPGVRYGSAMALGIACAGTGSKEALSLIEPMIISDTDSLVRQGALIASALILIRQNETTCPKAKEFRALYPRVIADKHEGQMVRFGAILAQGIIDAGGRNLTISLDSQFGHNNMSAIVGMFMFTQYWYWFPLSHFLCLSFKPTCVIDYSEGNNFEASAYPSNYVYPAPIDTKKKEDKTKVATAILSTTAKHRKKDADKAEKRDDKDDEGEEPGPPEPFEYQE